MSASEESCVKATNPSLYCVDTKDSFTTEPLIPVTDQEPKLPTPEKVKKTVPFIRMSPKKIVR